MNVMKNKQHDLVESNEVAFLSWMAKQKLNYKWEPVVVKTEMSFKTDGAAIAVTLRKNKHGMI